MLLLIMVALKTVKDEKLQHLRQSLLLGDHTTFLSPNEEDVLSMQALLYEYMFH